MWVWEDDGKGPVRIICLGCVAMGNRNLPLWIGGAATLTRCQSRLVGLTRPGHAPRR